MTKPYGLYGPFEAPPTGTFSCTCASCSGIPMTDERRRKLKRMADAAVRRRPGWSHVGEAMGVPSGMAWSICQLFVKDCPLFNRKKNKTHRHHIWSKNIPIYIYYIYSYINTHTHIYIYYTHSPFKVVSVFRTGEEHVPQGVATNQSTHPLQAIHTAGTWRRGCQRWFYQWRCYQRCPFCWIPFWI